MSSFECPICLEFYNATVNVPTSFPCGHSCCLRHTVEMMVCHVCRSKLPDKLTVNVGYRDGAIEFVAMMNRLARLEPSSDSAESTLPSSGGLEEARVLLESSESPVAEEIAPVDSESCADRDESVKGPAQPGADDDEHVADEGTAASAARKKRKPKKKKASQPSETPQPYYPPHMKSFVEKGMLTPYAASLAPSSMESLFRHCELLPRYPFELEEDDGITSLGAHNCCFWWLCGEVMADFDRTPNQDFYNIHIRDFCNINVTINLHRTRSGRCEIADFNALNIHSTLFVPVAFVCVHPNGKRVVHGALDQPEYMVLPLPLNNVKELLECYVGQSLLEDGHPLCWSCKCHVNTVTFTCKKCHKAKYCSKACQAADRAKHKKLCDGWEIVKGGLDAIKRLHNIDYSVTGLSAKQRLY